MSKTRDGALRTFVVLTLLGLGCFTGLVEVAAHSTHEVMLLVMALYFGGIGFTSIGVLGLVVVLIRRLLFAKPNKDVNA